MDADSTRRYYEISGRVLLAPPPDRGKVLEQELAKLPPEERENASALIALGAAQRDPEIIALKQQLQHSASQLEAAKAGKKLMDAENRIEWPKFIIGCILLVVAIIGFFWGFSLEHLSESRRFLLLWMLPLASGFASIAFLGSIRASGPVGTLAVAATGGFAVWLITFLLLKATPG